MATSCGRCASCSASRTRSRRSCSPQSAARRSTSGIAAASRSSLGLLVVGGRRLLRCCLPCPTVAAHAFFGGGRRVMTGTASAHRRPPQRTPRQEATLATSTRRLGCSDSRLTRCRAFQANHSDRIDVAVTQRVRARLLRQRRELRRLADVARHHVGQAVPAAQRGDESIGNVLDAPAQRGPPADRKTSPFVRYLRSDVFPARLLICCSHEFARCSRDARCPLGNAAREHVSLPLTVTPRQPIAEEPRRNKDSRSAATG